MTGLFWWHVPVLRDGLAAPRPLAQVEKSAHQRGQGAGHPAHCEMQRAGCATILHAYALSIAWLRKKGRPKLRPEHEIPEVPKAGLKEHARKRKMKSLHRPTSAVASAMTSL